MPRDDRAKQVQPGLVPADAVAGFQPNDPEGILVDAKGVDYVGKKGKPPAGPTYDAPKDAAVFLRLPSAVLERLDKLVEAESKRVGHTVTRSAVLRSFIDRAIELAEDGKLFKS
jgi:hypothetical protein